MTAAATPLTYGPRGHAPTRDAMVARHLPLVRRLAWHVHGAMSTLVDVEDLVQVGLVALIEAGDAVADETPAGRAYLTTRLRGAMIDELRRQATATRGAMRRKRRYADAVATLSQQLGHAPGEAMLAQHIGVSIEKLRSDYMTANAVTFEQLDDVYSDELDCFADDRPDAFAMLAESDQRDALIAAIAALPEREAQVIQLYYVEELNLEEIGQVFGIGAARVCQIKASAHARLKKALARSR